MTEVWHAQNWWFRRNHRETLLEIKRGCHFLYHKHCFLSTKLLFSRSNCLQMRWDTHLPFFSPWIIYWMGKWPICQFKEIYDFGTGTFKKWNEMKYEIWKTFITDMCFQLCKIKLKITVYILISVLFQLRWNRFGQWIHSWQVSNWPSDNISDACLRYIWSFFPLMFNNTMGQLNAWGTGQGIIVIESCMLIWRELCN